MNFLPDHDFEGGETITVSGFLDGVQAIMDGGAYRHFDLPRSVGEVAALAHRLWIAQVERQMVTLELKRRDLSPARSWRARNRPPWILVHAVIDGKVAWPIKNQ